MTQNTYARLDVSADPAALATHVADWLIECALAKQGTFSVALAGGSTPRRLYETLANGKYLAAFPWDRTHWFWGDERCVPHDNDDSNYNMARKAMLAHAPVPTANIHAFPTEDMTPAQSAEIYAKELQAFYGSDSLALQRPLFDVVLLGLGEDGHTASLFPNTDALDVRDRWATAVAKTPTEMRLTLTYPVLESAHHVAFLVAGKDKRDIFKRFRAGDQTLPSARVKPTGETIWFVDTAVVAE